MNGPEGLALDAAGNLYISDSYNNRIRKVDATSGLIDTVAGNGMDGFSGDGGISTRVQLNYPRGISVGGSGTLYIADTDNMVIRSIGF